MTLRIGRRSFTLIEVLVCVAVLSTGIVFIFQSFFTCLNAFNRYVTYYNIMPWMNEQLWTRQDEMSRRGMYFSQDQGEFNYEGKAFHWRLVSRLVDKKEKLCRLDLTVSWQEARRPMKMKRYAYTTLK
jgi:prepilin-type N-terminal cleavage/methylation domain-containing protein